MTPEQVREYRALADAATPKEWFVSSECPEIVVAEDSVYGVQVTDCGKPSGDEYQPGEGQAAADAALIAAARTAVPALCDTVDELRKELAKARTDLALRSKYTADVVAKGGCWFYAPCPNCGAIEGMGLTSRTKGAVSVWCCYCEHFGPPIEGSGREIDRAAVQSWNAEFAAAFNQLAELQRQNTELLKQLNRMATVADVYGADGVEFFEVRNDSLDLIAKYGGPDFTPGPTTDQIAAEANAACDRILVRQRAEASKC